jgi:hypothetical protein
VNEEYACGVSYYGVAVGITAGVIAGISFAIAGAVICAAATAGGGYAVSKNYDTSNEGVVRNSPLYRSDVRTGHVLST